MSSMKRCEWADAFVRLMFSCEQQLPHQRRLLHGGAPRIQVQANFAFDPRIKSREFQKQRQSIWLPEAVSSKRN